MIHQNTAVGNTLKGSVPSSELHSNLHHLMGHYLIESTTFSNDNDIWKNADADCDRQHPQYRTPIQTHNGSE
jgi:hypothetical protein